MERNEIVRNDAALSDFLGIPLSPQLKGEIRQRAAEEDRTMAAWARRELERSVRRVDTGND